MVVYNGGQQARYGSYVNLANGGVFSVAEDVGSLPGNRGDIYLKMPLAIILAPIIGLAYLFYLPLAGFVVVGGLIGVALVRSLIGLGRQVLQPSIAADEEEDEN